MPTFSAKKNGQRKEMRVTTAAGWPKEGDTFTIAGCGVGHRGQKIEGGRSVDTGRKAECKTLTVFKVGKFFSSEA